ncbi:large subunit ribosomal protein L25 [Neobacillus bataviensis]|jgi:large subunit ribosomal protein L25|uniref:Large ribosomal subunit protein bL25 n=1 Tax=Neobacillus bataviensis TaxID=220685 RepID=A0A561CFE0_9BACI|nr:MULTISPECIES: 50S ribosomal protein L25/general stress protein Ctc [Bacillaceae]PFO02892.1 50S ribosomal protein L25/general stress protein Ctc [Bacillus sp. AFS076308]PGV49991.1 50S ribosomal protein L25/general stress protein Ctc [Bacillus sp. AFS037270]TWD89578.1 large subunit ribosomal protein L25 [Neobacillus bataviensis]
MSTVLQAKERTELRHSALKQLRNNGNIPAVVYGAKVESKPVFVSSADLTKTIRTVGRNGVISLDVDGNKYDVVLSDYQEDSFKKEILHVDFLAVDKSSKINVEVRLALVGEAIGVKDGGVLQQSIHQLSITSTPDNIPQQIEVDITNLQVGETVLVGNIPTGGGFTINHEDEEVVASILPPRQEEEINSGEQQQEGHPDHEEGRETTPE